MKKFARNIIGIGLATCAACAMADTSYTIQYEPEAAGLVSDSDGRIYSYVVYGATDEAVPVVSDATDVSADGRGPMPAASYEAQPEIVSRGSNAWRYEDHTAAEKVSVGQPDVNQVQGRA